MGFGQMMILKQMLIPSKKPLNISEMTEEQFNEEMDKAYQSIIRGEGIPVEEAFARIKRTR